ncbi:MAG TPA: hypothetical protein VFH17_07060 [Coriobacteriia bacterium]|nr:hypothetical protein [Coriobacteriia bacterium]
MSERESKRVSAILESMGRYLPGMAAEAAFIAGLMLVALAGAALATAIW